MTLSFNEIQKIKRQFFAYRNGVTADALRKGGSPFKIIFGLTLSQLSEMARDIGYHEDLALKLWENRTTRCSLLLAPMLLDPQSLSQESALKLIAETPCYEVADVLCLKLLSRSCLVPALMESLNTNDDMQAYIYLRLQQRQFRQNPEMIKNIDIIASMAENHRNDNVKTLAKLILMDINKE